MNNNDLAHKVLSDDVPKADARKLVDAVFADAAAQGEKIAINGFGKFKVKDALAREGRNGQIPQISGRARSWRLSH